MHALPVFEPLLGHALPQSVGAVPLTLVLTGVIALFLAANALATRRAAAGVGTAGAGGAPGASPTVPSAAGGGLDAAVAGAATRPSAGQLAGVVALLVLGVLASAGPADAAENLADTAVLTLLWGAVGMTSCLVGPWWPRVDPVRGLDGALSLAIGDPDRARRTLPDRVAVVGVVVALLSWAWVQLLVTPSVVTFQLLLLGHVSAHLVGAQRYGPAWLLRVEPLHALSRTLGLLRPGGSGAIARLVAEPDRPWVRAVSSTLIGWSVADLVLETEAWHDLGLSTSGSQAAGGTLLVGAVAVVAGLVHLVSQRTRIGPAFVAVAGGWVVAHYLSLLVIEGQGVPIWLSDPFATGADLLGRRDAMVDLEPVPLDLLAALQAVPFVLGHLAAVVVVQRRAAAVVRRAGQLGPATFPARAVIAVLLVGGMYLQLGGL